jgi:two-component system cell cycle sensor histidine kinase/response regulator CckA
MGKVGMAQARTALEDSKRLDALRAYDILDTSPEPVFNHLAKLAAQICGAPYAAIYFFDGPNTF